MTGAQFLCVKNWPEFQHYRDRKPAWIKLHRSILDDYEFHLLPDASRALAPCIWLLASEFREGKLPYEEKKIAFRLHMKPSDLVVALKPLIEAGFLYMEQGDSKPLSETERDAIPEKEREIQVQTQEETESCAPKRATEVEEFVDWYSGYPRKIGKGQALKAFKAARKKTDLATLKAGLARYAAEVAGKDQGFIAHPATWLNGERWLDDPGTNTPAAGYTPSLAKKPNGHGASNGGLADSAALAEQSRRHRAEKIKDGDRCGGTGHLIPKFELERMMNDGLLTLADLQAVGLAQ
jgi:hypothetical protein